MNKISIVAVGLLAGLLGSACAVSADGTSEPEAENLGAQSSALVTTVGSGYAWVLASGSFGGGWNSTSGAITTSKLGTGQYQVDFAGQSSTNANAQVVAYGSSSTRCKLVTNAVGTTYTRWLVLCHDAAGALTDSAFNILTDHRTGSGSAGSAYLTSSMSGSVSDSFNSGGGTNTVAVDSTGVYTVTMPGFTSANSSVHVTATGLNGNRCQVGSWGLTTVRVRCFDASGAPANTGFSIARRPSSLIDGQIGGHGWVSGGTLPSGYTLTTGSCPNNIPQPMTLAAGGNDIVMTLPDATLPPGGGWPDVMPIVTAYGAGTNTCKVVGWGVSGTTASATVRCFDNAGVQVNASTTPFTFTFTSKHFPFC